MEKEGHSIIDHIQGRRRPDGHPYHDLNCNHGMIDMHKSIRELENWDWPDSDFGSYVVQTSQKALKKPLNQLSLEEIRLLLTQRLCVPYVLPMAVAALEQDILQEVYYYEGDLLNAVLGLPEAFWKDTEEERNIVARLVKEHYSLIKEAEFVEKDNLGKWGMIKHVENVEKQGNE